MYASSLLYEPREPCAGVRAVQVPGPFVIFYAECEINSAPGGARKDQLLKSYMGNEIL